MSEIVILDFYADWCAPCKMVEPIIEQVIDENKDVKVVKVNVDDITEYVDEYNITAIPTLVILDFEKKVIAKLTGVITEAKINQVLSDFRNKKEVEVNGEN